MRNTAQDKAKWHGHLADRVPHHVDIQEVGVRGLVQHGKPPPSYPSQTTPNMPLAGAAKEMETLGSTVGVVSVVSVGIGWRGVQRGPLSYGGYRTGRQTKNTVLTVMFRGTLILRTFEQFERVLFNFCDATEKQKKIRFFFKRQFFLIFIFNFCVGIWTKKAAQNFFSFVLRGCWYFLLRLGWMLSILGVVLHLS